MTALLPRASLLDVARGRARVVGSRLHPDAPRGFVSPIEARVRLGLDHEGRSEIAREERVRLEARSARADARALLSAAVAAVLAPRPSSEAPARPRVVSAYVDNLTADAAIARILERGAAPGEGGRARMVHFVHPHALNLAVLDAALRAQLARADLVLPDGVGVRVAARILGVRMLHNLNGTDLLPRLCDEAAARDVPLALVGAAPGVAARCARNLRGSRPSLRIPIVESGFLDAARTASLRAELAELARAHGRIVVLVGMGSPRQEAWAARHLRDLPGLTVVTVGGLFDFYAGDVPRAPPALRELGLEWVFRIAQEPRRLLARYALGNPAFLALAVAQRAGIDVDRAA